MEKRKEALIIAIALIILIIGECWVLVNVLDDTPPAEIVVFGTMISQTNTTAVFATEDGHLFSVDVGELLGLHTDYILVFDTNKTADRTDDVILSVSKNIK